MSKATKRKHVTREVLDEFVTPEEKQIIVKIIESRGNNLHKAETPDGKCFLISMPSKFRKNVWIKRGDFVIVDPIEEGNKVCAEIAHILYPQQVKYLKKEGLWPETFLKKENGQSERAMNGNAIKDRQQAFCSDSDTDQEDDLFVNPNHFQSLVIYSDSSDEEIDGDDISAEEDSDVDCSSYDTEIKTIIDNNNTN